MDLSTALRQMSHGGQLKRAATLASCEASQIIDFSANLNPFGIPAELQKDLLRALSGISPYPDPYAETSASELAAYYDLPAANCLLGNGAADLLFRLLAALSQREAGGEVLLVEPGFSEYRLAALAWGLTCRLHPLSAERDWLLDDSVLTAIRPQTRILILASPNNPTGQLCPPELLTALRERSARDGFYLILDNCFTDFLPRAERAAYQALPLTDERLVVLHSLTKFYALAGLRAGYALCGDPDLADAVRRLTPPWQFSYLAGCALSYHLREQNAAPFEHQRQCLRARAAELKQALLSCGAEQVTGKVNYLFCRWPRRPDLQADLLQTPQPLLIRDCSNYPGLKPGDYRFTIRSEAEQAVLIRKIRKLANNPGPSSP